MSIDIISCLDKVHAPLCDCSKVVRLRDRIEESFDNESSSDNFIDMSSALVVLPDIKRPQYIFACFGTRNVCKDNESMQSVDLLKLEQNLSHKIFSSKVKHAKNNERFDQEAGDIVLYGNEKDLSIDQEQCNAKVSCAACLLKFEPNGFACVSSASYDAVAEARDKAMFAKAQKKKNNIPLHADHADYVCVISRKCLSNMQRARKLSEKVTSDEKIIEELKREGIKFSFTHNLTPPSIELGHHLESFLKLTSTQKKYEEDFWLVMVTIDSKGKYCIDLVSIFIGINLR